MHVKLEPISIRGVLALCIVTAALGGLLASPASAQTTALPDSSGPQSAVPTSPPGGGTADVPGGSARNGVVRPRSGDGATPVITPPIHSNMPILTPPGMSGQQTIVVPK